MKIKLPLQLLIWLALFANIILVKSQPTWTVNPIQSPFKSGGLMLLLSDGSVLCKSSEGGGDGFGSLWFKLTPNSNGSYMNGTWSTAAPMDDTRLYFSSQVLKNGKVYVAGGEYGTGVGSAELYDPLANTWLNLPAGMGHVFADANSAILDNGKILQADLAGNGKHTYIYNPQTNSYSSGPNCVGMHDESTWIKLPDNSIMFVDLFSTASERYIPYINQWVADGTVPTNLYDPFVFETGPSILLPNGKVICFGSTGNTAIYTPSGNSSAGTWVTGPPQPAGRGCPDTQAAMKTDGKIIFTAANSVTSGATAFDPPTYFYEYDYITNAYTALQAPGGGVTVADSAFNFNMLNLPDGTIMLSQVNNNNFYFHKPSGPPLAAGAPTINSVSQNNCANSFTATGILFNGISEGASYGDDWQMNTNFPIVRLQSGSNIYYARTYNWNHTGVQTGTLADTTEFSLPPNIPAGTYSLYVVVNGISSAPHTFTFNSFPTLVSPLTMTPLCSGTTFTYNAASNMTGTTIQWTRPAVNNISNPAINMAQSSNPSETFTNTGLNPETIVYSYTLTNGACQTFYSVNCVISNGPDLSITGNTLVCPGSTLAANGAASYTWNTGANTNTISLSTTGTSVYVVSAKDPFGCISTSSISATVKPVPVFTITGNSNICVGDSTILTVVGNPTTYNWDNGATSSSISVNPISTTSYTVYCTIPGGCQKSDSIQVIVSVCDGIKELSSKEDYRIYPNPCSDYVVVESPNNVKARLTDASGRLIKEQEIQSDQNLSNRIVLRELDSGIYFLTLQGKAGKTCYRIIKE